MKILSDMALESVVGGKQDTPIGNSINSVDSKTGTINQDLGMVTTSEAALQGDGKFNLEHYVAGLNK